MRVTLVKSCFARCTFQTRDVLSVQYPTTKDSDDQFPFVSLVFGGEHDRSDPRRCSGEVKKNED